MRVAVLLLILTAQLAAQGVEARSRRFRVVTLLPPETASGTAVALERTHAQLAALGFAAPSTLTEVVLFTDLLEMQPYGQGNAVGFFQQGTEASFLAVAWKEAGNPQRALAHELVHRAMVPFTDKHPLWLREGLADLLSNLEPVAGGLKLGSPVAAHMEALRRAPWIDWGLLLSATRESDVFNAPATRTLFYAQSWLLAHRLVVGRLFRAALPNDWRRRSPRRPRLNCRPSFRRTCWQKSCPSRHSVSRRPK